MSRKTCRRRPRRAEPARAPLETPVNWERLRQVYANMRGRSITLGYRTLGITVEASTPRELAAETGQAMIEATKRQRPS